MESPRPGGSLAEGTMDADGATPEIRAHPGNSAGSPLAVLEVGDRGER